MLFLDEPTVGLDPRIRHELLDVIAGLRARDDLTILVTTHYLDEAQRLCDRVAIIHEGSIVALDSPQALLAGLGREILEFRVDGEPASGARRCCGTAGSPATTRSRSARGSPSRSTATPPPRRSPRSSPSACARPRSRPALPNLDDVYLQLTGGALREAA